MAHNEEGLVAASKARRLRATVVHAALDGGSGAKQNGRATHLETAPTTVAFDRTIEHAGEVDFRAVRIRNLTGALAHRATTCNSTTPAAQRLQHKAALAQVMHVL